jgi:integrase/recombinase XerD
MLRAKRKSSGQYRAPTAADRNPMMPYVAAFLEWSAVIGRSPQTIKSRGHALRRFVEWADERGLTQPAEITLPILERYQRHLYHYRKSTGEPLGFGTQLMMLVALKTFFRWATREHHILYNPASELMLPRRRHQLPRHLLSIADVETIINQTDVATPDGLRDRAILETLYSTGIRRGELVNLSLYDMDTRHGTLMVRQGKGFKDRMVPLGARAAAWLDRYRDEVRPALIAGHDPGHCFLTDFGEPFEKNRLTAMVKRYLKRADFHVTGACHLFRHAMATHMLENGADIRYIQAILGHSNLETTAIYTRVSIHRLQVVHAATHPAKATREAAAQSLLSALDDEARSDDERDDDEA